MRATTLVSCIMPSADRPRFVPQAIAQFLHQDYEHRELIVLDDGVQSVEDLMPDDPRVRYVREERAMGRIFEKRDISFESATSPRFMASSILNHDGRRERSVGLS